MEGSYQEPAQNGGINKLSIVPGRKVSLNFYFTNSGSVAADTWQWGKVYVVSRDVTEQQVIKRFRTELSAIKKNRAPQPIEPGGQEESWFTAESDGTLSEGDISQIADDKEQIFVLVSSEWKDPSGEHYEHYCLSLQPPPKGRETSETIWHGCTDFKDHK
ncbi:MAG TPA: hypothetical protein VMT20_14390 [Terriglobia bacterium]|nr:hypothetical protein [Terriglobia bacterium]